MFNVMCFWPWEVNVFTYYVYHEIGKISQVKSGPFVSSSVAFTVCKMSFFSHLSASFSFHVRRHSWFKAWKFYWFQSCSYVLQQGRPHLWLKIVYHCLVPNKSILCFMPAAMASSSSLQKKKGPDKSGSALLRFLVFVLLIYTRTN